MDLVKINNNLNIDKDDAANIAVVAYEEKLVKRERSLVEELDKIGLECEKLREKIFDKLDRDLKIPLNKECAKLNKILNKYKIYASSVLRYDKPDCKKKTIEYFAGFEICSNGGTYVENRRETFGNTVVEKIKGDSLDLTKELNENMSLISKKMKELEVIRDKLKNVDRADRRAKAAMSMESLKNSKEGKEMVKKIYDSVDIDAI